MIDGVALRKLNDITNMDVPGRPSFFQLNFFVLEKEPTHQAKLKRCVEELRLRKADWFAMHLEKEELCDQLTLAKLEADKEKEEIHKRIMQRRITASENKLADLENRIKDKEEEIIFFVEAFEKLSSQEPMRQWDSVEVQTEYWNAKLTEDIKHRLLTGMPIDMEIVKTALVLPGDAEVKKQITMLLKKQQEKMLEIEKNTSK